MPVDVSSYALPARKSPLEELQAARMQMAFNGEPVDPLAGVPGLPAMGGAPAAGVAPGGIPGMGGSTGVTPGPLPQPGANGAPPFRYAGNIHFDLPGMSAPDVPFASGGHARGSAPYGVWPIQTYQAGGNGRLQGWPVGTTPTGTMPDPRYPGAPRNEIMIHAGRVDDIDKIYSAGCLSVLPSQWPAFRDALRQAQTKYGPLVVVLKPGGQVLIRQASDADKPVSADTYIEHAHAAAKADGAATPVEQAAAYAQTPEQGAQNAAEIAAGWNMTHGQPVLDAAAPATGATPVTAPAAPETATGLPSTFIDAVTGKGKGLRSGDSRRDLVTQAQGYFNTLGIPDKTGKPLNVDGDFGGLTTSAVQAYQKANGLTPDGVLGHDTAQSMAAALGGAPAPAVAAADATVPLPRPKPASEAPAAPSGIRTMIVDPNGDVADSQAGLNEPAVAPVAAVPIPRPKPVQTFADPTLQRDRLSLATRNPNAWNVQTLPPMEPTVVSQAVPEALAQPPMNALTSAASVALASPAPMPNRLMGAAVQDMGLTPAPAMQTAQITPAPATTMQPQMTPQAQPTEVQARSPTPDSVVVAKDVLNQLVAAAAHRTNPDIVRTPMRSGVANRLGNIGNYNADPQRSMDIETWNQVQGERDRAKTNTRANRLFRQAEAGNFDQNARLVNPARNFGQGDVNGPMLVETGQMIRSGRGMPATLPQDTRVPDYSALFDAPPPVDMGEAAPPSGEVNLGMQPPQVSRYGQPIGTTPEDRAAAALQLTMPPAGPGAPVAMPHDVVAAGTIRVGHRYIGGPNDNPHDPKNWELVPPDNAVAGPGAPPPRTNEQFKTDAQGGVDAAQRAMHPQYGDVQGGLRYIGGQNGKDDNPHDMSNWERAPSSGGSVSNDGGGGVPAGGQNVDPNRMTDDDLLNSLTTGTPATPATSSGMSPDDEQLLNQITEGKPWNQPGAMPANPMAGPTAARAAPKVPVVSNADWYQAREGKPIPEHWEGTIDGMRKQIDPEGWYALHEPELRALAERTGYDGTERFLGMMNGGVPIIGGDPMAEMAKWNPAAEAKMLVYQHDHPVMAAVAPIVGGAVATGPAMVGAPELFGAAKGVGVLGNMLRAAITGGAIGGTDSLVKTGNPVEALKGTLFGALGGAAGPVAGKAIGGVANKVVGWFANPLPKGGAIRAVSNRLADDGMTGADVAAEMARNPRLRPLDTSDNLLLQAMGLATQPGEARAIIKNSADQLANTAPDTILSAANTAAGAVPDTNALLNDMMATARTNAKAGFGAALNGAAPVDTAPVINAMDEALRHLPKGGPVERQVSEFRSRMFDRPQPAAPGEEPTMLPLYDANALHTLQTTMRERATSLLRSPDAEQKAAGKILSDLRQQLDDQIDDAAGGKYRPAQKQFADDMSVKDAFNEGLSVFRNRSGEAGLEDRPEAWKAWFDDLSTAEQDAARQGVRVAMDQTIRSARNPTVAAQALGRDINEEKLAIVLGKDEAHRLVQSVQDERRIAANSAKLTEGSQTEPRRQAAADVAIPYRTGGQKAAEWATNLATVAAPIATAVSGALNPLHSAMLFGGGAVARTAMGVRRAASQAWALNRNAELARLLTAEDPKKLMNQLAFAATAQRVRQSFGDTGDVLGNLLVRAAGDQYRRRLQGQ